MASNKKPKQLKFVLVSKDKDIDDGIRGFQLLNKEETLSENQKAIANKLISKPVQKKESKHNPHLLPSVAGRSDLWINHLAKNKPSEDDDYNFDESKIKLEEAKYKKYDENGFLITGYDYSQHLAKDSEDKPEQEKGEVVFKATVALPPKATPDIDYRPEELSPDEREILEALEYEGEEGAYNELEDDFVIKIVEEKAKNNDGLSIPKTTLKKFIDEEVKNDFRIDVADMEDYSIHEEELEYDEEEELRQLEEAENDEESYEDFEEIPPEEFEGILDEHIKEMENREPKKDKEENYDLFNKTQYEKLPAKEDLALQECLKKDIENESDNEVEIDDLYHGALDFEKNGTIQVVNDKEAGIGMRRQIKGLNIVDESNHKKAKIENTNDSNSEHESSSDNEENLIKIIPKRERGETKEEKAARKELLKQLKNSKKEKKREFKAKFKTVKKAMLTQTQSQINSGSLQGVSIKKV